jgi:hypothetical protein
MVSTALTVPQSAALATREGLMSCKLQVTWAEKNIWRDSRVLTLSGEDVSLATFVAANFKRPRNFHPEYAAALEILVANAVQQARERGFRITSIELGVWAYRTLTSMGKRITTMGLPEPIMMEDLRTPTRIGYFWIDDEGKGVMLRPTGGDQLVRLVDEYGHYYVPVDERTGDNTKFQAERWQAVGQYEELDYARLCNVLWAEVPLLDTGEPIPVSEACPVCTVLHDLGTLVKDSRGKTMCRECVGKTEHARSEARSQGWDYDAKRPIPVKALPNAAMRCEHKWGMQLKGPTGAMELSRECILCGAPKD